MFILGIVIFLSGVLLTMYLKHLSFLVFVNPAAIVMLATAILAILTATQGFKMFRNGLKAAYH